MGANQSHEVAITHQVAKSRVELSRFTGSWGGNTLTLGDMVIWIDDFDLELLAKKLAERFPAEGCTKTHARVFTDEWGTTSVTFGGELH